MSNNRRYDLGSLHISPDAARLCSQLLKRMWKTSLSDTTVREMEVFCKENGISVSPSGGRRHLRKADYASAMVNAGYVATGTRGFHQKGEASRALATKRFSPPLSLPKTRKEFEGASLEELREVAKRWNVNIPQGASPATWAAWWNALMGAGKIPPREVADKDTFCNGLVARTLSPEEARMAKEEYRLLTLLS